MTTEEENELTRLRRERGLEITTRGEPADDRHGQGAFRHRYKKKKNYEEMLSGGCLKEVPGVKGNDE